MKKIFKRIAGLLIITSVFSGCALLGDALVSFRHLEKGEVYRDAQNRFEVTCPAGFTTITKRKYGITYYYGDGISTYGVYAYGPEGVSVYEFTLEYMMQGIKNMMLAEGQEFNVEREEYDEHKGYQSLSFEAWTRKKRNRPLRVYVNRLVKTENYIYWIYYSNGLLFEEEPKFEERHFNDAYEFFDTVKFEGEFN